MAIANKAIFFLAIFALFLSVKPVLAADSIKTTEFYIFDSNAALGSSVSQDFAVYIGDNISTVVNPIKSAYFKISGTYAGGGTLNLTLNSANSKTYTLPSVSSPTYFEFLYADTASVINPATAGTYNYNFGMSKSGGLTVYGASAILDLTYQYAPADCPDGTSQKIKTTEFYVADSDAVISLPVAQDFLVYIGDNISTVFAPVKSAYFKVSGTYTGGGTVTFALNYSNYKTFTLPPVSSPTYFELLYSDSTSALQQNSATAGTYYLNFSVSPSGVAIYGGAVRLELTYQYIPPSCNGLPPTGELTSAIFDTTKTDVLKPAYNSIMWKGTFNGGNGRVRFQLATSDSSSGPWNYFGSSDNGVTCNSSAWYDSGAPDAAAELTCAAANHNNQRYFRYKIQICSNNDCATSGSISPQVDDVIVNWAP